jgi:hypothetical protein
VPWSQSFSPAQVVFPGATSIARSRYAPCPPAGAGTPVLGHRASYEGHAIQKDGATNHIRGDCVGSKLMLVQAFVPQNPIASGIDDTLARRWEKKIRAKGVFHYRRCALDTILCPDASSAGVLQAAGLLPRRC